MTASSLMDRLPTFTHPDEVPFQNPFLLVLGGVKWSVATDRTWIVGVRGAGPWRPLETSTERIECITRLLEMPPRGAVTVPVAALLEWSGPPSENIVAGRLCSILVDAARVSELVTALPFKRILVWDASEIARMPCVAFTAGDRWKAILAGVLQDTPPDIDPFDPTAQRKLFNTVMEMSD